MIHKPNRYLFFFLDICLLFFFFSSGCSVKPTLDATVSIKIRADGQIQSLSLLPGTSVEDAISQSGITLAPLDRIIPSLTTSIDREMEIQVIRVTEKFETEQLIIPFDTQTIKNETLADGETLRIQAGMNGQLRNTYRILYEDGVETTKILFTQEVISEALPEIMMIGIQSSFTEMEIPGKIVYLTSGNAWMMKGTSNQRSLLVSTGDLDGRIFSLSPDGKWLLFTRNRNHNDDSVINELWFVSTEAKDPKPVYLAINNIIHFADWQPNSDLTIAYSTVEPRETAPGWQANNDLILISFTEDGQILEQNTVLETNSGGIFGWWGTQYAWSPDGDTIAYSRSDSIGIIDINTGEMKQLAEILPFQTQGDWAWTPVLSWSPGSDTLYFSNHGSPDTRDESDQYFDISSISTSGVDSISIFIENTGMFSYPVTSLFNQNDYTIAYLQAIYPEKSETSPYYLFIKNPEGGYQEKIFPLEGSTGLEPQTIQWSPNQNITSDTSIGFIYQGNIWLINLSTLTTHQLTGDESVKLMVWK